MKTINSIKHVQNYTQKNRTLTHVNNKANSLFSKPLNNSKHHYIHVCYSTTAPPPPSNIIYSHIYFYPCLLSLLFATLLLDLHYVPSTYLHNRVVAELHETTLACLALSRLPAPLLGGGVKEVIAPQLVHHLVFRHTKLGRIHTCKGGDGERPRVEAGAEAHGTLLWVHLGWEERWGLTGTGEYEELQSYFMVDASGRHAIKSLVTLNTKTTWCASRCPKKNKLAGNTSCKMESWYYYGTSRNLKKLVSINPCWRVVTNRQNSQHLIIQ